MDKLLETLLTNDSPQLIERYVDKYLPKDPDNLERIYQQLKDYQPSSQNFSQEVKRIREIKNKKIKLSYEDKNTNIYKIRRTKSLVIKLKDKGLKTNSQMREQGNKIYEKKMNKISNPLKQNTQTRFLKKTPFNLIQQKYELNKNYYNNQEIQPHAFQPQMDEYLQRRRKLLDLIKEKKNLNSFKTVNAVEDKYKNIPSRALSQTKIKDDSHAESMIRQFTKRQSMSSKLSNLQMQQIMRECEKQVKKKPKTVRQQKKQGHYNALQKKLRLNFDQNYDIDEQLQKHVINMFSKEQYDRYNHDYMKIMKMRPDICKISKHEKDLLKNQLLFRQLLNLEE